MTRSERSDLQRLQEESGELRSEVWKGIVLLGSRKDCDGGREKGQMERKMKQQEDALIKPKAEDFKWKDNDELHEMPLETMRQ